MSAPIPAFIKHIIKNNERGFADKNEYHTYYNLNLTILMGAVLYFLYDIVYLVFLCDWRIVTFETAGTALCVIALVLNRRNRRTAAIALMVALLSVSIIFWAFFMDVGADLKWFIVTTLFSTFFFQSSRLRLNVLLTGVGSAAFIAAALIANFHTPVLYFPYPKAFSTATDLVIVGTLAIAIVISKRSSNIADREFKVQLRRVKDESLRDPLTGLWNRRILEHESFFKPTYVNSSLAMIDIDLFKRVNDTYGHEVGDKLLCHLSMMLMASFRRDDCIVRWGGEEFLLILSSVPPERAKTLITEFKNKVKAHPLVLSDALSIPFTFTAGIARLDSHEDLTNAINRADEMHYIGKNSGRDRVIYKHKN